MVTNLQNVGEWLRLIIDLGIIILPKASQYIDFKKNPGLKKDPFLLYDNDFLVNCYQSEHPVAPGIPYSELACLLAIDLDSIKINTIRGNFKLESGDAAWTSISKAGFKALYDSRKIGGNESLIHLRSISRENNILTLKIQKAEYYDQAKSNLILDWPTQAEPHSLSLRNLLTAKYKEYLPKLDDKRLANTVGIACLLYYWERGRLIPYLVKRVEKIGVYPGGIHCTASGAANWPDSSEKSFKNFFLRAVYQEMNEEIGIRPEDVTDLRAVSLCREFLRGGKPQLFFAGFTSLSRKQLKEKRINASNTTKKLSSWTEIERDSWLKSGDVVIAPNKLDDNIKEYGITLEGIGAYFFGKQYIEKHGQQFIR
jgi:hypothetical protein